MKRILLAWSFVIVATDPGTAESNNFVTVAPQPSASAWWVDAQFHPFETQVRGVPVNKIRASWCKASEFRRDLFPPDLAKDLDLNQASFSIDGYFDGSKVPQTALIGVYETCPG